MAKRIVALSSLDIYRLYERLLNIQPGQLVPMPLNEESPLREGLYPLQSMYQEGDRLYYYDKELIERVIMSDPDLPGTILRLPQVYGPGDHNIEGCILTSNVWPMVVKQSYSVISQ